MERALFRPHKRNSLGRHAFLREANQTELHGGAQSCRTVASADQTSVGRDSVRFEHVAGQRRSSGRALLYSRIEPGVSEHLTQIIEAKVSALLQRSCQYYII